MPSQRTNWKTIAPSQFPWEQEALDFVESRFPNHEPYYAWSNFEFIADDGSINEIDLMVLSPWGVFLIEIKSRPGTLTGDATTWTWRDGDQRTTTDSPVLLINRKCKKLASLLARQKKALRGCKLPFIDPLVFCSHEQASSQLSENGAHYVCLRDREARDGKAARPGIMAAIKRRECPGLRSFEHPCVSRDAAKGVLRAMDQIGIRPSQASTRVGDYQLGELLFESSSGTFQDWQASHVSVKSSDRLVRAYLVSQQANAEERDLLRRAAQREFQLLEQLDHPGILKVDTLTEADVGHCLIFRYDPQSVRLDHYLANAGDSLQIYERLSLLRQIGEALHYAHRKGIVHRALSPQSILVSEQSKGQPQIQIYHWQTGYRDHASTTEGGVFSASLHTDPWIDDASLVYLAPEAVKGLVNEGTALDSFSLGALAYLIFSGQPPATSLAELNQKLAHGHLDITDGCDGAHESVVELITYSAASEASMRYEANEFLDALTQVEEALTQSDQPETKPPLEAGKGDLLEHGFEVLARLGRGSVSVVLLVRKDDSECVLKLAAKPDYNRRLKEEFAVLHDKLHHSHIVKAYDLFDFDGVTGFTMDRAGETTLAQRLRKDGPLELELLQRFGEDLLRTIDYLEDEGVAHRDLKPDNIGVRSRSKGKLHLALFDFSLSQSPRESLQLGTVPYLEPFLGDRTSGRWDEHAERFAAAMTLHEMATGTLPKWGDGKSLPNLLSCEVTISEGLLPPGLRTPMRAFFEKALRRQWEDRHHTTGEMLRAWTEVFDDLDRPVVETSTEAVDSPSDRDAHLANATLDTQLVLLGLSTRLTNAVSRLDLITIGDLLQFPLIRIHRLPGVGNKTRKELANLVHDLRKRFPDHRQQTTKPDKTTAVSATSEDEPTSIEQIALSVTGPRETPGNQDGPVIHHFLGSDVAEGGHFLDWPSQSDLADHLDLTRARVGQILTKRRDRWRRLPTIKSLGDLVAGMLGTSGGVMEHRQMATALLAKLPSEDNDEAALQATGIALRAALEAEKALKDPNKRRFAEFRRRGRLFVSLSGELASYARTLGETADTLVTQEPIPTVPRVVAALRTLACPTLPEPCQPLSDEALLALAAASSEQADISGRGELYPRGLSPLNTLLLGQSVLFGSDELSVAAIRERLHTRYPEASPLPKAPLEMETLLKQAGLQFTWDKDSKTFRAETLATALSTSEAGTTRLATCDRPRRPGSEVSPEEAEAIEQNRRLDHAEQEGAFLAITVPPRDMLTAQRALTKRSEVEPCDVDALFLRAMKARAKTAGVDWKVVLSADAERDQSTTSTNWRNLQHLISDCLSDIEDGLRHQEKTPLLVNPGLLARYDRMDLLERLRDQIGRTGEHGIHGLWILVPADDQSALPTLDRKPIPIINPAQHERLCRGWMKNLHGAG